MTFVTSTAATPTPRKFIGLAQANLRNILYGIAIFTVLFVTGSRGVSLMQEREEALRRTTMETELVSRVLEERTRRSLDGAEVAFSTVEKAVDKLDETRRSSVEIQPVLERILGLAAQVGSLTVADPAGNVLAHASRAPTERPSTIVAGPLALTVSKGTFPTPLLYTRPLRLSDGRTVGWMQAGLRSDFVTARDLDTEAGGASYGALLDSSRQPLLELGDRSSVRADDIVTVRQIAGAPLMAEIRIPLVQALEPWRRNIAWTVVGLAILAVGLVLLVSYGRRLVSSEEAARAELQVAFADKESLLAEKEMLLAEVHHRIKNHLQVTVSLLQMQVKRFQDPAVKEALTETKDRLASIGLLHEAIYKDGHGDRVNLRDYLARVVGTLATTYDVRHKGIDIAISVPAETTVDIDRAIPLALIVNEAMTNALKYAFRDGGGKLSLAVTERDGEPCLEVRDDGPGLPEDAGESGSLGMRMIRALASQLGGPVTFENDGGAVIRIPLPVVA